MLTIEAILAAPVNCGWHVLPNGSRVRLGDGVVLGNDVVLGDGVVLGRDVVLGKRVVLDNCVVLGYGVVLGDGVVLGERVVLGRDVVLGNDVVLGSGVVLGTGVKLCDGVKLDVTPIYIQGSRYWIGYCGQPGMIRSGCINRPVSWWKEKGVRCAKEYGYNTKQITEYVAHFATITAWMELYGVLAPVGDNDER